jgi:hypothetical protein
MSNFNLQDNFPLLLFDQPWSVEKFAGKGELDKQVTFDELLLEKVGSGEIGPCLYINSIPRCLVATVRESRMPNFGAAQKVLAAQGWPVVVRCTGGSCVPQGPGVINLAVIHPRLKAGISKMVTSCSVLYYESCLQNMAWMQRPVKSRVLFVTGTTIYKSAVRNWWARLNAGLAVAGTVQRCLPTPACWWIWT